MSKTAADNKARRKGEQPPAEPTFEPVDVVDGIPDRSGRSGRWVFVAIAVVFLAWVGFLIYNAMVGGIEP